MFCCSLRGKHSRDRCRGHREPPCACARCCYLHSSEPAGVVCHRVLYCCLSATVGATCRDGLDIRTKYFRTLVSLYFCKHSSNLTRYRYISMPKSNKWYRFLWDPFPPMPPSTTCSSLTHNQTVTLFGSFDLNERFAASSNKQNHPIGRHATISSPAEILPRPAEKVAKETRKDFFWVSQSIRNIAGSRAWGPEVFDLASS